MEMDGRVPVATGGCQCGAVRYALYAAPINCSVCHCRMCQRATGGLFAAHAGALKENFAWTKGEPGVFASSNLAARPFCRECGTPLGFGYTVPEAKRFYISTGTLDDPEIAKPERQFGIESKISWVSFCEDLPSEKTGETAPGAAEFFAGMKINQG